MQVLGAVVKFTFMSKLQELIQVMTTLRDPIKGCPWDREQTHESLVKHLKEECAEFVESLEINGANHPDTLEELADVLFQIVFHCELYAEDNVSSFEGLIDYCAEKYKARHPHVFDDNFPRLNTSAEVEDNWQDIKATWQKNNKSKSSEETKKLMDQLKPDFDPLARAQQIGKLCEVVGFDWDTPSEVWLKVEEELAEFKHEQTQKNDLKEQVELGDVLFTLAQYARQKGWQLGEIAESANKKFINRFNRLEDKMSSETKKWADCDLKELEALWQSIK